MVTLKYKSWNSLFSAYMEVLTIFGWSEKWVVLLWKKNLIMSFQIVLFDGFLMSWSI